MKRIAAIVALAIVILASCKEDDEPMWGSLKVQTKITEWNGVTITNPQVALYDFSDTELRDPIYFEGLVGGSAEFHDINPGNYRVRYIATSLTAGAQVKAGQTTTIIF